MIEGIEIILYVNDVVKVRDFWKMALDAKVFDEETMPDGSLNSNLRVSDQVVLCLFNKKFIAEYSPEISLEVPSLIFNTADIQRSFTKIKSLGLSVGDVVDNKGQKLFNFSDPEGNYFVIAESRTKK